MSDDILETLQCGVLRYNEETRNYETLITKRERLAIAEIKRLRKENCRLKNLLEDAFANYDGDWPEDLVSTIKAVFPESSPQ